MNAPATDFNVKISNLYTENQTLYASIDSLWDDPNGVGLLGYQWQRSDGLGGWINIAGATSTFYALDDADVGHAVRVVASYVDGGGTTETAYSAASNTIINVNDAPTGAPVIAGILIEGAQVQAVTNGIADADGLPNASTFSYQWQRSTDGGQSWVNITGAQGQSYDLTAADSLQKVRVAVSYTDLSGTAETAYSVASIPAGALQLQQLISRPVGEFQVNTYAAYDQNKPSVTALADGGWVVTWTSNNVQDGGISIYGHRYDSEGSAVGSEFKVNTYSNPYHTRSNSSVTALADGGWVVTWESQVQDGSYLGIYGQRYDGVGTSVGGEFRVNSHTLYNQSEPSLVALADGGWVVTWTSNHDGSLSDIYSQRYNSAGATLGNEFRVNTYVTGIQEISTVTALADGGWVVVWSTNVQADGSTWELHGQRYTREGNPIGPEFKVNTQALPSPVYSSVAAIADGGWVVTWESAEYSSGYGIYGQRYDSSSAAVGAEFHVNTYTTDNQSAPSITVLADGGWVVTWQSNGQDGSAYLGGIYGQRYDSTGATVGAEFQINSYTANAQQEPSVTALAYGGWVVTWTSYGQDGFGGGIYSQRFDADGNRTYAFLADQADFNLVVGRQIRVDTSALVFSDAEDQLRWQWQRSADGGSTWVNIPGAILETYTLTEADAWQAVRLKAIYTDALGTSTVVYSETSNLVTYTPVDFAVGIVGSAIEDGTLVANASVSADADGLPSPLSFTYQWQSSSDVGTQGPPDGGTWTDIEGATSAEFTPGDTEVGKQIRVIARYVDGQGTTETAISGATGAVSNVNDTPTGFTVTVTGNKVEDQTLTATIGTIIDPDSVGALSYQWQRTNTQGGWSDIAGATSPSYTLDDPDVGHQVRLTASYLDSYGTLETASSLPTKFITGANDAPAGAMTLIQEGSGLSGEFKVISYPTSSLLDPSVASLADGGFVVTWTSGGVYAQRYSDTGAKVGTKFTVSTYQMGNQQSSSVTALSDGGWVVTWTSYNQDGSNDGVYGQRYDSSGEAVGSEFRINTYTADNQRAPSVTALTDGGWLVTWESYPQDGWGTGVYGQRYASDGAPLGAEFLINTHTQEMQYHSSVTALTDGGWVVTWQSNEQDGSSGGIYGQRYSSSGEAVGSEFRINTYTAYNQRDPSVTALSDGGWVVVWTSLYQDGSSNGVYGQRFSSAGAAIGVEFRVNTFTTDFQADATVAVLSGGGFVVTWHSYGQDGAGYGVYGQQYGSTGIQVGSEFQINTFTANDQTYPSVAALSNDRWIVTWVSYGQDGSVSGVYARQFFDFVEGKVLSVDTSQISDVDGLGTFAWQWQRSTDGGLTWTDITGATQASYILNNDDVASLVRAKATYIDGQGFTNTVYSDASTPVFNVNDAPDVASAITDQSSPEDTAWSFQVPEGALNDADGDVLTYSATLGNGDLLPPWLTFDAATRTFSGTPPQNFAGDISMTVNASDGSLSTSDTFALSVKAVDDAPSGSVRMLASEEQVFSVSASELKVNTFVAGEQFASTVAALTDGGWVISWQSLSQDGSVNGIYSQRYNRVGSPINGEFLVNTYTLGDQEQSFTTALVDGGWLITWVSSGQDGSGAGIFGQRYSSSGDIVGAEFRVNNHTSNDQAGVSATALADGGWLITWHSWYQDGSFQGIYGQRYGMSANKIGSEFLVNTFTPEMQSDPSVAALNDGGWIITWQSWNQDGSAYGVYAQRFSKEGSRVGNEVLVNNFTDESQAAPSVAALVDGGWVVIWQSFLQDGEGGGIYGQRFNSSGVKIGDEFQVNTFTTNYQSAASLGALTDGGWVVTWVSEGQDGSGNGVYGQRFDSTGAKIGEEFQVNTYSISDQLAPFVSALADGGWVITWSSQNQDVEGWGIYAQRYDAAGNKAYTYTVPAAVASVSEFLENNTLYADASLVTDADGMGPVSWQWQRSSDGGATWSDISGATGGSYTLGDADIANLIRLQGSYIDGQGFTNTVYSEASTPVINVNDAPVVANPVADQWSAEDKAWSYVVPAGTFSDVDGDALAYSATLGNGDPLPGWLSFDAATRTFSGTPPQDFTGDISLKVTASDGSLSVSDTFVLIIKPPLQIITGTSGNDMLSGIAGNVSEITGGAGNDTITGGSRADIAVFSGNRSDYTVTTVAGVTTVRDNRAGSPDGTDTLKGMNILRFADIQLFQTTAANKMTLAGQAQTYNVANSQVVQGTNAAEHFIVAPETSALVFAGTNDVVDLAGAIDSYTFTKTGTQLQISDGVYTTTLSVGGSFTLRTASGSTSVAIDFAQGGAIKLGGTQVVGSATFNPLAAILDAGNVPSASGAATLQRLTGTSGNDTLSGVAGKVNEITGGAGNDTITGGSRADIAVFSGNRSDYTITTVAGVTTVVDNRAGSPDGTDTLKGLNILRFADLQLFQSAAANKMILAGQAQTYNVDNSEVVQGTSAAEHFIVAPETSALVFAGNNDVVDLSGAIDSYTFTKTGTQLQISDGVYTTTLSVGGSFTLRTASGATSVAIDFAQGGAIKLGGTQIVGTATFDPLTAITDPENYSDNAEFRHITVKSGATYNGHAGIADVFVIDASQSLTATIVGFETGDVLKFTNHSPALGVSVEQAALGDALATLLAGNANITLSNLANDNFNSETSFEAIYGANAIGYVM